MGFVLGKDFDLSPREAAELLGVHEETLLRWARDGDVPCWKTPSGWRRFRKEDLEAFVAAGVQGVPGDRGAA